MRLNKPAAKSCADNNVSTLRSADGNKLGDSPYDGLLELIAEMFDAIAKGEDFYMIIGATSKRDSFSLTVKESGQPTTVYAPDLPSLCTQASTLL